MKKRKILLLPILFAGLLCTGLLSSVFTKDRAYSPKENRYLKQAPSFSAKSLLDGSFMEDYNEYLSDQFLLRDSFVSLTTFSEKNLFRKKVIQDVCFCKNGFLINRYTQKDIDTAQVEQNLNVLNQFQASYDAACLLVPPASDVLSQYLPGSVARLDFDTYLQNAPVTFSVDELLSKHAQEPIYYKTDHHWTTLGAYYVYEALEEHALPYEPVTISEDFVGTVAKKVGITSVTDSIEQQKSTTPFQVTYDNGAPVDSLYSSAFLETQDKYSYFLDGNHGLTEIKNKAENSAVKEESLLLIKDSFGNSLAPFLCEHYRTVYLIDLRHFNAGLEAFIKEKNIRHILFLYSKINFMQDKNLFKLLT